MFQCCNVTMLHDVVELQHRTDLYIYIYLLILYISYIYIYMNMSHDNGPDVGDTV